MSKESDRPEPQQRGPIAWMVRRPVASNLLMILLIAGGCWTALNIQKEVFPEFALDLVEVSVTYPGAAPAEVEQGILLPIEEAMRAVQGIKEMTSTAREGRGNVSLELVAGTDRMKAFQDIEQAVSRIRTFPDEIDEPQVTLEIEQREVMEVVIYGKVDIWTLRRLGERLRDVLLNNPAITQVDMGRVRDYVTHVEIFRDRLREYGLTLEEVARIVEDSSRDVPAGSVETANGEILLRMQEKKVWSTQFAEIPILTAEGGSTVTLGDLGSVTDGFEEEGFHSQFNQTPSVELNIYRVGSQSPLKIAKAVEEVMDDFQSTLPEGIYLRIDSNAAEDYSERLDLLIGNGWLAIFIVLAILALFLELRLAFWVMMGMTASFVGGLIFLPMVGVSINMVSMFAFLVVLGIVVDDAIVVGENVYEYRSQGMDWQAAAIKGAREMAGPVTFSILTNMVAFVPLLFIPGTTGKFWWPLPAVVLIVLALSLFEALFILPAHLGHTRARRKGRIGSFFHGLQQKFAKRFQHFVDYRYRHFLDFCLRYRYVTLTAALALLAVVGGFGYSGHMGMIMMPQVAAVVTEAGVRLPVGTTRAQSARVADAITTATMRMFEKHQLDRVAKGVKTNVRGGSFIDVEIVMRPPDEHDMTAAELIALWRNEIGEIPGVDQITFEAERGPGGWQDDISVALSHNNIDTLAEAAIIFRDRMKEYENTTDVKDNYRKGKAQFDFTLREEGRLLGLTPQMVGDQLRHAFYGALALRHLRGTQEVEMRIKLPKSERTDMHHLEDLVIRTPAGVEVPLLDVVDLKESEAFASLNRRDGRRVVTVGMDVEPESATGRVLAAVEGEELPRLRAEYPGLTWTFQGTNAEMRESTSVLWGGFALAMLVVYALLAVAFGSYLQPLIVIMAIPFGIVGAVIGHILLGFDLSLISIMGVIALSGVVVNDSLIMVDYANRQRGEMTPFEAIHKAGLRRFRPILLTTVTTFGGLTPIILETSRQAAYLVPMAISLGFGIIFATAIILVIVPCLYLILEDLKR